MFFEMECENDGIPTMDSKLESRVDELQRTVSVTDARIRKLEKENKMLRDRFKQLEVIVAEMRMRVLPQDASASQKKGKTPSTLQIELLAKNERMEHVKKPLNAFMLFMKENRSAVQAECTIKESAALNQRLGEKWKAMNPVEQAKYYEKAKVERENHAKEYPGWTAKNNYASSGKRERKRERNNEPKKCRAIFGIEKKSEWCVPCRRKKECVRFQPQASVTGKVDACPQPKSSQPPTYVTMTVQVLSSASDFAATLKSLSPATSTG